MHKQIDRLKEGDERACDNCGKIYAAIYFPYKSVNLCIDCYENEHNIILHEHRKKINKEHFFKQTAKIYQKDKAGFEEVKCPACNSVNYEKKGFRNQKQRYICKDCRRNWTSGIVNKQQSTYKKPRTRLHFQRENTLEEIKLYLEKQESSSKPLRFWYRNDIKPRKIYDYFVDERYVQVKSDKGYYIKFLIDKIRKIDN